MRNRRKKEITDKIIKAFILIKTQYCDQAIKKPSTHYLERKQKATPPWLTEEHKNQIKIFYVKSKKLTIETGVQYSVDHIIPLKGKLVCGLHVPWNLQVITHRENCSKNNRIRL